LHLFRRTPQLSSQLLFTQNEPGFGSAAFIRNGMLYVYLCDYTSGCKLGRVSPAKAQVRNAWSFFACAGRAKSGLVAVQLRSASPEP
jgi:hypothetical protein